MELLVTDFEEGIGDATTAYVLLVSRREVFLHCLRKDFPAMCFGNVPASAQT
jgi:hypothetical protein